MPTETQPELTRADLENIATQLDYEAAGLDVPSKVEQSSEATADQEKQKAPEVTQESGLEPAKTESKDGGLTEPAKETQAEIDYKAEYERIKKEHERADRSWKRLNEEKEALAKLKATARPDETRIAGDQFSAEEYEQYAEKLVEEGNSQDAKKAMTRAKEIRQKAFVEQYQESVKEAIDDEPELADQASDLAKAVQGLLNDPSFGGVPKGFKNAVRLVKAEKLAGSIPGLRGEIENYKKEIERLNKAMEIGGKAGLPKREGTKSLSDMSLTEHTAYLRQKAAEADDAYYN